MESSGGVISASVPVTIFGARGKVWCLTSTEPLRLIRDGGGGGGLWRWRKREETDSWSLYSILSLLLYWTK